MASATFLLPLGFRFAALRGQINCCIVILIINLLKNKYYGYLNYCFNIGLFSNVYCPVFDYQHLSENKILSQDSAQREKDIDYGTAYVGTFE